jgi:hypothetical protein
MQLRICAFFIVVLTVFTESASAQRLLARPQDSSYPFYPLAFGDYWEYFDYEWMHQLADTINALVTADTSIDGNRYTVVAHRSFHYRLQWQTLERFDSLGNLYRRLSGRDSLIFRFADTSHSAWYLTTDGWTARWDKSGEQTIFGASRKFISARFYNLSDTTNMFGGSSVTFVEGVGMTGQAYPEGVGYSLRGARIAGVQYGIITAVAPSTATQLPRDFQLLQNYPNPFNPSTSIVFRCRRAARVTISVHNPIGQQVALLVDDFRQPGQYMLSWHAESLSSGVYFCQLRSGIYTQTVVMMLVR